MRPARAGYSQGLKGVSMNEDNDRDKQDEAIEQAEVTDSSEPGPDTSKTVVPNKDEDVPAPPTVPAPPDNTEGPNGNGTLT